MSTYVSMSAITSDAPKVRYVAAHDYTYGDGKFTEHADAAVWARWSSDASVSVSLGVEDARALVTGLVAALDEHDRTVARNRVNLVKAVA